MKRSTGQARKKKSVKPSAVKAKSGKQSPRYNLIQHLLQMRMESGLTQEEMAELLGTQRPNISRLESPLTIYSPRLLTIKHYAEAAGYDMEITFKRVRSAAKKRPRSLSKNRNIKVRIIS